MVPVKGQILALIPQVHGLLRHVIRGADVYLVPRTDGRVLVGATAERGIDDKRVDPAVIQRMHQAAANLVPELGEAQIHEAWAGVRPSTADNLPIIGETEIKGYFVATGHYRNGVLLAPATGEVIAALVAGRTPCVDIAPFSPQRFAA